MTTTTDHSEFPTAKDLALTSRQYRIPPTFVNAPYDPIPDVVPKKVEFRYLSIGPQGYMGASRGLAFSCLAGCIETESAEADVHSIARRLYELGFDRSPDFDIFSFSTEGIEAASAVLADTVGISANLRQTSPFDFDISSQCIVMVVLDPAINWQFASKGRGVTTKAYYGTDNFGVSFIEVPENLECIPFPEGKVELKFTNPKYCFGCPENCKMLYFTVARRRPDADPPQPGFNSLEGFNFHLEFLWEEKLNAEGDCHREYKQRMPTIFDPDVPNTGNTTIP